jgi:hypothetical protein
MRVALDMKPLLARRFYVLVGIASQELKSRTHTIYIPAWSYVHKCSMPLNHSFNIASIFPSLYYNDDYLNN